MRRVWALSHAPGATTAPIAQPPPAVWPTFRVLHRDEDLVVIDKPRGFHVHPPEDGWPCPKEENALVGGMLHARAPWDTARVHVEQPGMHAISVESLRASSHLPCACMPPAHAAAGWAVAVASAPLGPCHLGCDGVLQVRGGGITLWRADARAPRSQVLPSACAWLHRYLRCVGGHLTGSC